MPRQFNYPDRTLRQVAQSVHANLKNVWNISTEYGLKSNGTFSVKGRGCSNSNEYLGPKEDQNDAKIFCRAFGLRSGAEYGEQCVGWRNAILHTLFSRACEKHLSAERTVLEQAGIPDWAIHGF